MHTHIQKYTYIWGRTAIYKEPARKRKIGFINDWPCIHTLALFRVFKYIINSLIFHAFELWILLKRQNVRVEHLHLKLGVLPYRHWPYKYDLTNSRSQSVWPQKDVHTIPWQSAPLATTHCTINAHIVNGIPRYNINIRYTTFTNSKMEKKKCILSDCNSLARY